MNFSASALIQWLIPGRVRPFAPEAKRFLRSLDVMSRARFDGVRNLPAAGDTDVNAVQKEIFDACQAGIESRRQFAFAEARSRSANLEKMELTPADLDFEAPKAAAEHQIVRVRSRAREHLAGLRLAERQMFRELCVFQAENRLARSAHYPSSQVWAVGILMVILAAEAFANARLFADADALGLLGGVIQALIVSALNVFPSFAVGILAFRNLHHVRGWRRLAGAFGTLAWCGAVASFNLLVGHFRLALQADPDQAVGVAVSQVLAGPLAVTENFHALILVVVGAFSALLAAIDGYCWFDDRYPGYGKMSRRYQRSLDAYTAGKKKLRSDIEATTDAAVRDIGNRLSKVHRKVVAATRIINEGVVILDAAARDAEHCARLCEIGLRTYREENARVRTTPAPEYFDTYPVLDCDLGRLGDTLRSKKDGLFAAMEAKKGEAKRLTGALHALAEREIQGIGDFILGVEADAEATMTGGTASATRKPRLGGYLGQGGVA